MSDNAYRSRWDQCDECEINVIIERDDDRGVPDSDEWDSSVDCPLCGATLRFGNADEQTQAEISFRTGRRLGFAEAGGARA